MSSFVPYDSGSCVLPEDFWDHIIGDGAYDGEYGYAEGFLTDYPDVNPANGYADFYDEYMASQDPSIVIKPSQGHAGI